MNLTIEPASSSDIDAIDGIERHSFKTPWPRQCFVDELARAWARVEVARLDGRVVGFLDYWLVKDEVHLLVIATHPDFRRRGVGGQLMVHLLAAARSLDMALLTLEVRASNVPAIALYQAHGFRSIGLRRRYYADDGEDASVMVCALRDLP